MAEKIFLLVEFDKQKGERFRSILCQRRQIAQRMYEDIAKNEQGENVQNIYKKEVLPIDTLIVSELTASNLKFLIEEK